MHKDSLRDAIDTYNELLRLHQLNLELLETFELSLFWLMDFSEKHNIPIPNRDKFARLLNKIHALVTEISTPPNLQHEERTPKDSNSPTDKFTEPPVLTTLF